MSFPGICEYCGEAWGDERAIDDLLEGIVGAKEGAPGAAQIALDAFFELFPSYRARASLKATIWQARMKREQEKSA